MAPGTVKRTIPLLLPPKIRLITNSCSSFVTVHSCLLFCAHNFHQYSVTLSCIIAFLMFMSLVLVFTADFIHSDQLFNYSNRLTVYTFSVDRFMPLYVALRRFTSSLIWQLTHISCDVCKCLLFSFIFAFLFVYFFTLNCDNYNL